MMNARTDTRHTLRPASLLARGLAGLACLSVLAGAAAAQSIRSVDRYEQPEERQRSEDALSASIRFRSGPPDRMGEARLVRDGETAWTEAIFPAQAVRLTADVPHRNRPRRTAGIPAGTLLFGVQLPGETAFCQPLDYTGRVERVQCLTDSDNDGAFDGGFVTREQNMDSGYLIAVVHGFAEIADIPYETIYPQEAVSTTSRIVLDMRGDTPTFRRYIDEERLDARYRCRPLDEEPELCSVLGVNLRIEPDGDAFRITPVETRPYREFGVQLSSNRL